MEETLWPAPLAMAPVSGEVMIPGSKSITNRALVIAAISAAPSVLRHIPQSRDSALMMGALSTLGVTIDQQEHQQDMVVVTPLHADAVPADVSVDCGLAGTVMRFVPPVAALARGEITLDGDARARERPLRPLLSALTQLGVNITGPSDASLPLQIAAHGSVPGGAATIDASGSSQFVSALLIAAARFHAGLQLTHAGPPVPSLPHIAMTCTMLAQHDVHVTSDVSDPTAAEWTVPSGPVSALDRTIEPDLSNATPFLAAAMITGGTVRIQGLAGSALQPVARVQDVFTAMGATFASQDDALLVSGTGRVQGIAANLGDIGELVPTVAALAALADSPSDLTGIGHLAGHETDRLAALVRELSAMGSDITRTDDGLHINPRPLHAAPAWHTYHDHRMATAGAILGLVTDKVMVENIATTAKTFPTFPSLWRSFVTGDVGNREAHLHAP